MGLVLNIKQGLEYAFFLIEIAALQGVPQNMTVGK